MTGYHKVLILDEKTVTMYLGKTRMIFTLRQGKEGAEYVDIAADNRFTIVNIEASTDSTTILRGKNRIELWPES